jgi:hypothetical protein
LEAITYLKPKKLLLDTLIAPKSLDVSLSMKWPVNAGHYRYNFYPDSGAAIMLGENSINSAMKNLGFSKPVSINKKTLTRPRTHDSPYFQEWKKAYSKWWSRSGK